MTDNDIDELLKEPKKTINKDTRTGCLTVLLSTILILTLIIVYSVRMIHFNDRYALVERLHSCNIIYDKETKVMYTYSYTFLLGLTTMDPILNADGTPKLYEGE